MQRALQWDVFASARRQRTGHWGQTVGGVGKGIVAAHEAVCLLSRKPATQRTTGALWWRTHSSRDHTSCSSSRAANYRTPCGTRGGWPPLRRCCRAAPVLPNWPETLVTVGLKDRWSGESQHFLIGLIKRALQYRARHNLNTKITTSLLR
jgi:hypothetical protein